MAITTLDRVVSILGTINPEQYQKIEALIPLVQEWIEGYCEDTFLDSDGNESFPKGYELIAIKMIDYDINVRSGVNSKSIGKMSVSFNEDYPQSVTRGLKRKVKLL